MQLLWPDVKEMQEGRTRGVEVKWTFHLHLNAMWGKKSFHRKGTTSEEG